MKELSVYDEYFAIFNYYISDTRFGTSAGTSRKVLSSCSHVFVWINGHIRDNKIITRTNDILKRSWWEIGSHQRAHSRDAEPNVRDRRRWPGFWRSGGRYQLRLSRGCKNGDSSNSEVAVVIAECY